LLTGDGVSDKPRPDGLSGWVTTKTTSCSSESARKIGTPKLDVPKKTMRKGFSASGLDFATGLCFGLRFSFHGHCFADVGGFVDDQDSVEVVDFVL
jgi:hypothetical protein